MKTLCSILAIMFLLATCSFAQNGGYLLINDDDFNSNFADIDTISSSGALALMTTVQTFGAGGGGGFFTVPNSTVGKNLKCFFVSDSGTNDVAAFQIPSLKRVTTNFTNPALSSSQGIGLAATPNGKFLISAWSGSQNLAVLSIASDCSLTLVGTPINQPDLVVDLTVTANSEAVVVSYPDLGGVQAYSISKTGTLTPVGSAFMFAESVSQCSSVGCFPSNADVTANGQFWVWGNATLGAPSTLTATLTSHGFTNPALQTYTSSGLQNVEGPWFSPAARAGNGNLYLGAAGFGTNYPAGIIVANFNHGVITYASATPIAGAYFAGNVQSIGKTGAGSPIAQMWGDSEANNTVQSYTVNGTTLTPADGLRTSSSGSLAEWITGAVK